MKTEVYLMDRFEELLEKCDYSEINVTKFCEYSNISRTTFYRYYQDLHDLGVSYYDMKSNEVFEDSDNRSYYDIMVEHNELILEPNYASMFSSFYGDNPLSYIDYVSDNFYTFSKMRYKEKTGEELNEIEAFQLKNFVKGGAYVFYEIFEEKQNYSPSELAYLFDQAKPAFIKEI